MSNRDMSLGNQAISSPRWAGDYLSPDVLIPGGARIDASLFSAYPGPVTVRVGGVATAAAAVAGAGNTGNGTVGSITGKAGARTQTITLTATDATHFTVTGSVDGALGTATTGVAFTANGVIALTITAGGTAFIAGDSFTIALTQSATGAAAGATSIPVSYLSAAIPNGSSLVFGPYSKIAILSADAALGAQAVTVYALDQAIAAQDVAIFAGSAHKIIPSGTFVSRTFAQRAAGALFHPAVTGEDEFYLTAFDVLDATKNDDIVLVRPKACIVKENFLPGWSGLSANLKADLRATYTTIVGVE